MNMNRGLHLVTHKLNCFNLFVVCVTVNEIYQNFSHGRSSLAMSFDLARPGVDYCCQVKSDI